MKTNLLPELVEGSRKEIVVNLLPELVEGSRNRNMWKWFGK